MTHSPTGKELLPFIRWTLAERPLEIRSQLIMTLENDDEDAAVIISSLFFLQLHGERLRKLLSGELPQQGYHFNCLRRAYLTRCKGIVGTLETLEEFYLEDPASQNVREQVGMDFIAYDSDCI